MRTTILTRRLWTLWIFYVDDCEVRVSWHIGSNSVLSWVRCGSRNDMASAWFFLFDVSALGFLWCFDAVDWWRKGILSIKNHATYPKYSVPEKVEEESGWEKWITQVQLVNGWLNVVGDAVWSISAYFRCSTCWWCWAFLPWWLGLAARLTICSWRISLVSMAACLAVFCYHVRRE